MTIFDDLKNAFATTMNVDPTSAGWVLGFIVIVVFMVALIWLLGEHIKGVGILIPAGVGIAFVAIIGWWPLWAIAFLGLIVLFAIFNPLDKGTSGGM